MKSVKDMTDAEVVEAYNQLQITRAKRKEARDTGMLDTIAIGAGRTLDKAAAGLEQGAMKIGSLFGSDGAKQRLKDMEVEQRQNDREYSMLSNERPIATGFGELAPLLASPAMRSIGGAAAMGSAPGLISYGDLGDKMLAGGIGAVGGALGKYAGDKLVGLLSPKLQASATERLAQSAQKAADLDELAKLGIKPTVGEATGSKALKHFENLNAGLIGGGHLENAVEANKRALASAVNRTMGESGDSLTEATVRAAKARLGPEWDAASRKGPVYLGKTDAANQLQAIADDLAKGSAPLMNDKVLSMGNRAQAMADIARKQGVMKAEDYVANRGLLNDLVGDGSDRVTNAAGKMKGVLDEARAASFSSPDEMAQWMLTNKQYANAKTLENIASGSVDGTVSPARLFQATRGDRVDPELRSIARLAREYSNDVPNSGTAQKQQIANVILGGASAASMNPLFMAIPFATARTLANPTLARAAAVQVPKALGKLSQAERRLLEEAAQRNAMLSGGLLNVGNQRR